MISSSNVQPAAEFQDIGTNLQQDVMKLNLTLSTATIIAPSLLPGYQYLLISLSFPETSSNKDGVMIRRGGGHFRAHFQPPKQNGRQQLHRQRVMNASWPGTDRR